MKKLRTILFVSFWILCAGFCLGSSVGPPVDDDRCAVCSGDFDCSGNDICLCNNVAECRCLPPIAEGDNICNYCSDLPECI